MPPKYVRTIREELQYEYAKLISRSAFDGKLEYAFITDRFKALTSGTITISGTIREWEVESELPRVCVFCGSPENLQQDHLVPRSRGGRDAADNMVWTCRTCNTTRGDKGIFEWLGLEQKDKLHRLVAGKYLKELFDLHERKGTLDIDKSNITQLCGACRNGHACAEWDTVEQLTCLCLESIF
jgi:hypothetical protein